MFIILCLSEDFLMGFNSNMIDDNQPITMTS